jgi:aarF domain-containing kinase
VDLTHEAQNLLRFAENFAGAVSVRFPRPVLDLCREAVLVESFEPGEHVARLLDRETRPALRKRVAEIGMDAFLKMALLDAFVHADLHPGNILVDSTRGPGKAQLVFLDAGLVTELSPRDRENFRALFSAVAAGDGRLAARLMAAGQTLAPGALEAFSDDIERVVNLVASRPLAEVQVGHVFSEILASGRRHRVRIEPNFSTLVVGTLVLEGLGRQLDPDINIIQRAKHFLGKDPSVIAALVRARLSRPIFSDDSPSSVFP